MPTKAHWMLAAMCAIRMRNRKLLKQARRGYMFMAVRITTKLTSFIQPDQF